MADEDQSEDVDLDLDEEEGGAKKGKRLIIIIVLLLITLGGAGAGVYFSGILGGDEPAHAEEEAHGDEHADDGHGDGHGEPVKGTGGPVFYELPEFLVNLNTGGRGTSFLKMKVTLELPYEESIPKVEAIKPRIEDSFNTYLRELRASDLSGSAGLYRLREEMLMRINKVMHPDQVNDILFKEIVVQ